MDARRDAALGAAAFVLAVREIVAREFPECVATVGDIATEPGSFNVVPRLARLRMECRSLDAAELTALEEALGDRARREAEAFGLERDRRARRPVGADADGSRFRAAVSDAATALGLSTMELPSGAGHDAQALAPITPVRDGLRAVGRRDQPRPERAHRVGRLRQRRERPARGDGPARADAARRLNQAYPPGAFSAGASGARRTLRSAHRRDATRARSRSRVAGQRRLPSETHPDRVGRESSQAHAGSGCDR